MGFIAVRRKLFLKIIKIFLAGLFSITVGILIYFYFLTYPTNDRNWLEGMETLAHIQISANQVTIQNVRDNRYNFQGAVSYNNITRTVNLNSINRVWFVQEPFSLAAIVAHTYFVFDFSDQEPLVLSVEARREKGQAYSALTGLLNQYELIYIWGTETDQTVRRAVVYKDDLYMYPLAISPNGARLLFLQLAKTTQDLETQPRFYNTLTSNCTNELAKSANAVKPGTIPWNLGLIFPGMADQELYKLGLIPNNQPFDQTKQRYKITAKVQQIYDQPDFSAQLRDYLLSN